MTRYAKALSLVLSLALVFSLLAGCTGARTQGQPQTGGSMPVEDQGAKAQDSGKTQDSAKTVPENNTLPIVKQPITLTYYVGMDAKISATLKNYKEMTVYKELEKRTGITLDFQHPPVGQEKEQFNLMIASRQLPDIIESTWVSYPGGPEKAMQDEIIIPLNDLVGKYCPNFSKLVEKDAQVRKEIKTDEGKLYTFPALNYDPSVRWPFGFQIRQDWLEKINMKAPATIEEWKTVLQAFKEKDPNGNGSADEIPFVSQGIGDLTRFTSAWGIYYDFYIQDRKVKYGPAQPEYKEFITTLANWYKEGLLDVDFATTDGKQKDTKVTKNVAGTWIGWNSGNLGRYLQLMRTQDPNVKIAAVPYPKSKDGKTYHGYPGGVFTGQGASITPANKKQAETARLFDYLFSDEGNLLNNFGLEGLSFQMKNGVPTLSDNIIKNPNGLSLDQALGQHSRNAGQGPGYMDPRLFEQRMYMPEQKEAIRIWSQASSERMLPPITPKKEESDRLASVMSEINTYRDEMIVKFIMGQESLSNLDKFNENIKKLGIEEATKIQQAALDRYNARN